MKLRTKIAIGTLGFLMAALFLCCSLLISTSKNALLDNAIDYSSQEEEKLVAAVSSHENELSEIEMKLTASTVLKYFFFQEMQSAAAVQLQAVTSTIRFRLQENTNHLKT